MASLTGRIANFMSRNFPGLARSGGDRHVEQYRASKGKKSNKFLGRPVFLLDVVGRKSGKSVPVMLMLVRRGDDLLVCGSFGGNPKTPGWCLNLAAAGEASDTASLLNTCPPPPSHEFHFLRKIRIWRFHLPFWTPVVTSSALVPRPKRPGRLPAAR